MAAAGPTNQGAGGLVGSGGHGIDACHVSFWLSEIPRDPHSLIDVSNRLTELFANLRISKSCCHRGRRNCYVAKDCPWLWEGEKPF